MTTTKTWYVQHRGKSVGPVTSAQLKTLAQSRKIDENTLVRVGDEGEWICASRIQKLFDTPPSEERIGRIPKKRTKNPSVLRGQAAILVEDSILLLIFCGSHFQLS